MADKPSSAASESGANVSPTVVGNDGASSAAGVAAPKKPVSQQNPALKMMGLPRLRLPSRNWLIFLSITGSIAGAVTYDKWQTRRMREKWCNLVSHIADEPLPTKTLPRRVTVYLAAPPGDGLRSAREHFHTYIKPILVSAAMDWDVVEGRKEGDVRHKTADKIRKRRKLNGEGEPMTEEDEGELTVESLREKNGDVEYPGVAGDIVIGRHTWKEYIRGIHEGYLGPADSPKEPVDEVSSETASAQPTPGQPSVADAAVSAATKDVSLQLKEPVQQLSTITEGGDASPQTDESSPEEAAKEKPADEKKEEEKPKRRFPPSTILPDDYQVATLSPSTPEVIGPCVGVRFPHLLGIRNTPIRMYRFLTRRRLQDEIGQQVASAILASHRPYGTVAVVDDRSASDSTVDVPEPREILAFEERDWWKTVHQPRQEHEESVFIEPMALDDRIVSRMRAFQLTAEDGERAKRIEAGTEKPLQKETEDS